MFEKKGDTLSILFPKVIEIDAKYDYSKEPDKIKDLFSICRLMQENSSSIISNEYIFKRFNSDFVGIYAGSTSIKHYQANFLKRLAEVFYNLNWAMNSGTYNKEVVKEQFYIYQRLYLDLAELYRSHMPGYLSKLYSELKDKLSD